MIKATSLDIQKTASKRVRCLLPSTYPALTSADDQGPFAGLRGTGEVSGLSNMTPLTNQHTGHMTKRAAPVAQACAAKYQNPNLRSNEHFLLLPNASKLRQSRARGRHPHGRSNYSMKSPHTNPSAQPASVNVAVRIGSALRNCCVLHALWYHETLRAPYHIHIFVPTTTATRMVSF